MYELNEIMYAGDPTPGLKVAKARMTNTHHSMVQTCTPGNPQAFR